MAKVIERVINSEGSPLENDLWLRWVDGQPHLFVYAGTEWKEIVCGGGSPASGSGSGPDSGSGSSSSDIMVVDLNVGAQGFSLPEGVTFDSLLSALRDGKEVVARVSLAQFVESYGLPQGSAYGWIRSSAVGYTSDGGFGIIAISIPGLSMGSINEQLFVLPDNTVSTSPEGDDGGATGPAM